MTAHATLKRKGITMTDKHTEGPWAIYRAYDENGFETGKPMGIEGPNGEPVVSTDGGYYPLPEANARLIAAAPELLEALEGLINSKWLSIDCEHNRTPEACDRRAKAIQALDKAKDTQ